MKNVLFGLSMSLLLVTVACDDNQTTQPPPPSNDNRNMTLHLQDMSPHVGQLVELRVVSSGNQLQAQVILDPLPSAQTNMVVKSSVPEGTHRLDFFADLNMDDSYDPPPEDHAWRLDLPATGEVEVTFSHNTDFTDIDQPSYSVLGSEFRLDLFGFNPHVGQLFGMKVIHTESGRTVGQYRLDVIPNHDFDIEIRDIIQSGAQYQIDFYADLNRNGTYDAPPIDHAWRVMATGMAEGLDVSFTHNTAFTDIDF